MNNNKGITLIALVITVIALLILAGTAISLSLGQDSLFEKTNSSVERWNKKAGEEENSLSDAMSLLNIITGSTPPPVATISKETSFVGYYADIEGDGTVDGIIYADLALGTTGTGTDMYGAVSYTIPTVTGIRDYYVSQEKYSGFLGTKDVLTPTGTGNDRFYIMSLNDLKSGELYCWYAGASGELMLADIDATSQNFGSGNYNTATMISKWNSEAYGEKNHGPDYEDIWGNIDDEFSENWFVPSSGEWAAFVGELGITEEECYSIGMDSYWCSDFTSHTDIVNYTSCLKDCMQIDNGGFISGANTPGDSCYHVRMSKMF
ncbi:MAG: hypothetical protein IKP28_03980 [Clostridia bacterium]|nr:hypothetical protein [Clostridia bacterium]